jgi:glutathione peroxidase
MGLERLHGALEDEGFGSSGFLQPVWRPEPGTELEIREFCSTRYDVTFPLSAKSRQWPRQVPLHGGHLPGNGHPGDQWNFEKFLVGRDERLTISVRHQAGGQRLRTDIAEAL